ncbi:ABC transporter substrate-binding protein [Luteococcus sediminum]
MTPGRARRGWLLRLVTTWTVLLVVASVLVQSARRERSLSVLCSSVEEACEQWTRTFTEHTGVEVVMVRMSSGEALTQVLRADGEFDVWHGGPSDLYEVARAHGQLVAHRSPQAAFVPARFKARDGSWTGVYRGMLGFCSNRRVLDQLGVPPPRRWEDLLDKRLAGAVSMPDPRTSGTGWTMLWTVRQHTGSDEATMQWLDRLQPNVLQYTSSGVAPSGIVARGEAAVGVTFTQHCVRAQDRGAQQLLVGHPQGATGAETGAVAILRSGSNDALARSYVDFSISPASQAPAGDLAVQQLPTRSDVPTDPRLQLPAGTVELVPPDRTASRRQELVQAFDREVHP